MVVVCGSFETDYFFPADHPLASAYAPTNSVTPVMIRPMISAFGFTEGVVEAIIYS